MSASKILLVEDSAAVRESLRLFLQSQHFVILEATTCAEALTLAETVRPDLVLLDLGLPDGDGLEVLQALRCRAATAGLRIAVFSGERPTGRRAELISSLGTAFIPRPIALTRLEHTIRLLLARPCRRVRRYPRYPVEVPTRIRPRGAAEATGEAFTTGVVRTLSEGGLMVELPVLLAVASTLDLWLRTPAGEITAAGKVVWTRSSGDGAEGAAPHQHGIQFITISAAGVAALKSLAGGERSVPPTS